MEKDIKKLKVAIVHDWMYSYTGGERVVNQLHILFPDAPIYTLIYNKQKMPDFFNEYDIRTLYFQKLPFSKKLYKNLLTLMPGAWENLDLMEYDLVVSSCSSCCKGIVTRPDAIHICYCHTPTRYVWDFYHTYKNNAGLLKKIVLQSVIKKMRIWDRLAADRVDYFVANSHYISKKIKKYYKRESEVIYPGFTISDIQIVDSPDDYYLTVGRLIYYKRTDLAIDACTKLNKRLIVVGIGEEEKHLSRIAGSAIEFKGYASDSEIKNLYAHAKAFIFPGEEDFGITPLEAQSAGCPVLAYGKGGALETIKDGQTGLFFKEQTSQSLIECIEKFEKYEVTYTRKQIKEHSLTFGEERFRKEMMKFCINKLEDHFCGR